MMATGRPEGLLRARSHWGVGDKDLPSGRLGLTEPESSTSSPGGQSANKNADEQATEPAGVGREKRQQSNTGTVVYPELVGIKPCRIQTILAEGADG